MILWLLLVLLTLLPSGVAAQTGVATGMSVTATDSSIARTLGAMAADAINVKNWGAKGDGQGFPTGVMTSGSPTLTDTTNHPFLPTDCTGGTGCTGTVNKAVSVDGAGAAGVPLSSSIIGYTDSSHVTLANNASTTIPYTYLADHFFVVAPPTVATPQSGAGSYAPGNTITLTGGTATTQATVKVLTTQLVSATANAVGSGGTTGACVLTGTTGVNQGGSGRFKIAATISGGAISAIGAISVAGSYTTNPTSLTAEPVTSNCSLTGATLTLKMGVLYFHNETPGIYSVFPSNPVAQGSTTGSGTGATFTMTTLTTGGYSFGTDDSAVISSAMTYAIGLKNGLQPEVYFPAGSYYMKSTTTPLITKSVRIGGDGPHLTYFIIDPAYVGDLFSTSEVWALGYVNGMAPTQDNAGVMFDGFTAIGNIHATGTQNVITFYDRNDFAIVYNIQSYFIHGQVISTGTGKNVNVGFVRESLISQVKAMFCGTSTLPCVRISSTNTVGNAQDATNEMKVIDLNIFSAVSTGLIVDNVNNTFSDTRLIKFVGLRVEQSNNGDNLDIGLAANTGRTTLIDISGGEFLSAPGGFWGIHTADNAASFHNYGISAEGIEFAGWPGGGGIYIENGWVMHFGISNMTATGYNVQTSASANIAFVEINAYGNEAAFSANIGAGSVVQKPSRTSFP